MHGTYKERIQNFGRRPDGKKPTERPLHGRTDNIKMDLKEIEYEDVPRIHVAQDIFQWRTLVTKKIFRVL